MFSFLLHQTSKSSKYAAIQYALDGVNFVTHSFFTASSANSFAPRTADFSGIPGIDNNANLAVRVVAAFQMTAIGSGAASYIGTSATYGSGAWNFDMATFTATAVPEASPLYLCGLVGIVTAVGCGVKAKRRTKRR